VRDYELKATKSYVWIIFAERPDNIKGLFKNSYFDVIRDGIYQQLYINVDEIYNPACPNSHIHYKFDSVQTIKVIVTGSIYMFGLAKRLKIKNLSFQKRNL